MVDAFPTTRRPKVPVTPAQLSSISDLLDHADRALSGTDFCAVARRATRASVDAADFDDCFVELRARLREWVVEPPANVSAGDAALAFIEFVDWFTPDHGVRWYPIRDEDRYPAVSDWFCEDSSLLLHIEEAEPAAVPARRLTPATAARALLDRLHPQLVAEVGADA